MNETYFLAVIESLGQTITALKYQNESYTRQIEDLRTALAVKNARLAVMEGEGENG